MFARHPRSLLRCAGKTATQPLGDINAIERWRDIHIDGSKSTVSDGAADGTSESKARVETETGGRVRRRQGSKLSLGGIDLAGAGGSWGRSGGHFGGDETDDKGLSGEVGGVDG